MVEARVDISSKPRTKDIKQRSRPSSKEHDLSVRQTDPSRIKIFEGGYVAFFYQVSIFRGIILK